MGGGLGGRERQPSAVVMTRSRLMHYRCRQMNVSRGASSAIGRGSDLAKMLSVAAPIRVTARGRVGADRAGALWSPESHYLI